MATFSIVDKAIGLVTEERKNINGVPGIKYYFARKTVDTTFPIEISFVRYDGVVYGTCPQVHDGILDPVEIDGVLSWTYQNDIIFSDAEINAILDNIPLEQRVNNSVDVIKNMFGIDISGIDNIDGIEFDKLLYIDRLDDTSTSDYFDGYMLVFTDCSTRTMKLGLFAGKMLPYTYSEYLDELNEYGKTRLLSEIIVENGSDYTLIRNTSNFRVKLDVEKYKYNANRIAFSDKNYTFENVTNIDITLDPGGEYTLVHEKHQSAKTYNLVTNPIKPPEGPIYISDSQQFLSANEYINEEPFKVTFKEVMSLVGATDPERFVMVSSFHNLFDERGVFSKAIVDVTDNLEGLEVHNSHGTVRISDDVKFKRFITDGATSTFVSKIKVMFKSKLRRIYSHLGEDQLNIVIDYALAASRLRILSMENRIVYNDTVSAPMQAFAVTLGLIGNADDIMRSGQHLEYENTITEGDIPCKDDRRNIIDKIMNSDIFDSSYIRFNANDVIDNPTKKVFSGPPYRTYNGELDDAYEQFQTRLREEITGFELINSPAVLSSSEFAAVMPALNMQPELSDPCYEDFVYSVEDNINELGIEYNLNEVLKKIRKSAYIYRKKDGIVATVTIGMTLDEEWYFCGEDFFPSEAIDNNEFTTYMDNEIISLSREMENGLRPIYDKKLFLDSNDWDDDYKQYMHDAFMAIIVGSIKTSTVNDNPGMRYIAEHLFDSNRKLSFSYDEMFLHARDSLYAKPLSPVNNTLVMPNIFAQLIHAEKSGYTGFIGDDHKHFFGKAKAEYTKNYADLNTGDAYDSAYEIGHTIDVMFDINSIKTGARLFEEYRKMMFGVDIGEFEVVDSITVVKSENAFIGSDKYAFVLSIVKNGDAVFKIGYDYLSKKITIEKASGVKIVNYALLMATFDIFVHDFYDTLEGYKRVSLGIYDYYESSLAEGTLSKKYLFLNNTKTFDNRYTLHYAIVGVYDDSIAVRPGDEISGEIMGYGGLGNELPVDISTANDTLTIDKGMGTPSKFSFKMLENYPSNIVAANGVSIKLYRTKRFLPTRFMGRSLKRAMVSVVGTTRENGDTYGVVGDVKGIDFGGLGQIDTHLTGNIVFALGGEGLQMWIENGKYASPSEIIIGIDDIMSSIDDVFTKNILGYDIEIVFE
jgi:hypothetical protein